MSPQVTDMQPDSSFESPLAEHIWRRYGDSPGVIRLSFAMADFHNSTRLALDRLPLLEDLQQRWTADAETMAYERVTPLFHGPPPSSPGLLEGGPSRLVAVSHAATARAVANQNPEVQPSFARVLESTALVRVKHQPPPIPIAAAPVSLANGSLEHLPMSRALPSLERTIQRQVGDSAVPDSRHSLIARSSHLGDSQAPALEFPSSIPFSSSTLPVVRVNLSASSNPMPVMTGDLMPTGPVPSPAALPGGWPFPSLESGSPAGYVQRQAMPIDRVPVVRTGASSTATRPAPLVHLQRTLSWSPLGTDALRAVASSPEMRSTRTPAGSLPVIARAAMTEPPAAPLGGRAESSEPTVAPSAVCSATASTAVAESETDVDDIVERVLKRFRRELAVEYERRGWLP